MIKPVFLRLAAFIACAAASSLTVGCGEAPVGQQRDDAHWWLDEPAFTDVLDEIDVERTLAFGHSEIVVLKSQSYSGEEAYARVRERFGALQEHNARVHTSSYAAFIDAYNDAMERGDMSAIEEMIGRSRTEACVDHPTHHSEP